jgi:hypothetical protein
MLVGFGDDRSLAINPKDQLGSLTNEQCKTLVMEREMLALRQQLEAGLGESCLELSTKIGQARSEFAALESTVLASVATTVDSKLGRVRIEVESGMESRIATLDARVSAAESEATAANAAASIAARRGLEQPTSVNPMAEEVAQLRQNLKELVRALTAHCGPSPCTLLTLSYAIQAAADQQMCCEHDRYDSINSELQAAVARLETSHIGLKQELSVISKLTSELVSSDQLNAMEMRLAESHRDVAIEMQLQLSNALDRVDSDKNESMGYHRDQSERSKAMAHQLQEVDHVTRLIGKQLVRTVSQLQVLWEERRAQLEAVELCPDDAFVGLTATGEDQDEQNADAKNQDDHDLEDGVCSDESLTKIKSEHNALQSQVSEKLQHYQSLLQLGQ